MRKSQPLGVSVTTRVGELLHRWSQKTNKFDKRMGFPQLRFSHRPRSRHLVRLSDGSLQMDMTKTPSLMMMDLNSFMQEAAAWKKNHHDLNEETMRNN